MTLSLQPEILLTVCDYHRLACWCEQRWPCFLSAVWSGLVCVMTPSDQQRADWGVRGGKLVTKAEKLFIII